MIPAPESWARVDAPRPPKRPMDVVVTTPDAMVAYRSHYAATMDAYGHALATYPDAVSISVTPAQTREAKP